MALELTDPLGGKGRLTDAFGWRDEVPGVVAAMLHTGQDWYVPTGSPVFAMASGRVTRTWWDTFTDGTKAGGNMIELDHGGGVLTRYAHLSRYAVKPGATVKAGQLIAYSGMTGAASGPHLHGEVLIAGKFVDPLKYLTITPATLAPIGTPMLLAYYAHAAGKNKGRYAFFGPGFWLELESTAVTKRFKSQLGMKGRAYRCKSASGWASFKASAQAGAPSALSTTSAA